MRFTPLAVEGAYAIDVEPIVDERGFFARAFDGEEFARRGLTPAVSHCNLSRSLRRGTLRGLHYQLAPHAEAKLVRCIRGAIFDVVADLRPGSSTHLRWAGVELTDARRAVYVPEGCAHGFLTLLDDTEVFYQVSAPHRPEAERGVRWDDPALAIAWPAGPTVLSARDAGHPPLRPAPAPAPGASP